MEKIESSLSFTEVAKKLELRLPVFCQLKPLLGSNLCFLSSSLVFQVLNLRTLTDFSFKANRVCFKST